MTSEFPKRLRYLREKKGISRRVLSERCGVSKNMVAMYERGERKPGADVLCEIADLFEVSTDYLLGRTEK